MKPQHLDSTDALLTAFDTVANSNSHLLAAPFDGDLLASFRSFVSSSEFREELLRSDRARNWHNYHELGEGDAWRPLPGEFFNGGDVACVQSMSALQFRDRLQDLLAEGPCFYGKRLSPRQEEEVVGTFCRELVPQEEIVLELRPTFLYGRGEGEEPLGQLPYFEGCGADRCYLWRHECAILVLLLNGCP